MSKHTLQVTLQQSQTAALLSLLNLDSSTDQPGSAKTASSFKSPAAASSSPPVWKILVLDHQTKDVLATVLRVQDLRDVGVTLHVYVNPIFVTTIPIAKSVYSVNSILFARPSQMFPLSTLYPQLSPISVE
jgi:hypothetical protein